jgi:uncharacterized protein YfaS (alpha-2-macroglobulin family)
MPTWFRRSPALVILVPAVALALAAVAAPPGPGQPAAVAAKGALKDWAAIDKLVDEQKLEEASRAVAARLAAARAAGDEEEWTRALIRQVQLRSALHGYETSVRLLKDEAWPKGTLQRTVLQLFYARTLVDYAHAYSWEIRQRERVESGTAVDLKAWTLDQIAEEALRAYDEIWRQRAALGTLPLGKLSAYLQSGSYPANVRGTLRDAVSYLLVELLSDSSLWRPEQVSEVFRLDLPSLLEGRALPAGEALRLTDASVHPLVKIAAVLGDLEVWHAAAGRREAQLEARLERVRRLRAHFNEPEDRARIRAFLEQGLPGFREVPWWAVGMAELAGMVRAEDAPDAQVEARRIAEEGRQAYPDSIGGQQCRAIVRSIEAPDFRLSSMTLDGARKRSLQVTHRNLPALHFRAFRRDVVRSLESARDYNLLGTYRDLQEITSRRPDVEWSVTLPATPDYRSHVTYVTPPLDRPGLYTIAASVRSDFGRQGNRIVAATLIVSDLVLVTRHLPTGIEVAVVHGATGAPVPGAEVALYQLDWQNGHRRLAARTADQTGVAVFDAPAGGRSCVILASLGEQVALDPEQMWLGRDVVETERQASLVYTDRSIYRPLQNISWKVVAYRGGGPSARFHTLASAGVTVTLVDPNNQTVESRTVTTNEYGSAAGEFTIPAGRVLGQWWLRTSPDGQAAVRVEEYKRPTFEATLDAPETALRLNRPARLSGHARYYFGLPVTAGTVRWRVVREPVWPRWWGPWFWDGGGATRSQTVAGGSATLEEDGRFRFEFTPQADERKPREVSYRYSVTADVTDDGGETRSATRSYRLGFVAVEATLQTETAFLREGEEADLVIRRVDLDGEPRSGEGSWRLLALDQPRETLAPADQPLPEPNAEIGSPAKAETAAQRKAYRTPGDRLRPRWAPRYTPEAVLASWPDGAPRQEGRLEHAANGEATLRLRGLAAGAYRLRYETKDEFGATFALAKELVVAGETTRLQLPALLLAERSSIPVGETARLLVVSGFPAGRLVVDIQKAGRRVARHVLTAGRDETLLEIPISEADRGGFGVTLTAVLDHQLVSLTQRVFVPWDDRELKLSFASFRDRLRPGAKEAWRVEVRTVDGKPPEAGAAELLAYMYDRSLDVFAPHDPPSVLALYPNRTGTAWLRASLGERRAYHLFEDDFAQVTSPPILVPTSLKQDERYGIGGMGRRNRMVLSKAAPAPAAQRAGLGRNAAQLADAVEGGVMGAVAEAKAEAEAPAASPVPPPAAPAEMRSNFSETAFWQPHLLTAADGSAAIEFTVPDSVTSWNVWVHALTRDLRGGSLHKEARSVKELMVRPYLPRFLREGDRAQLKVVVNNAGERPLSGTLVFDVVDPATETSLLHEFGLGADASRSFTVKPGGSADLVFPIVTPARVGQVAFKATARAEDLSDGELRPLPILPGRMHLVESRFVTLRPGKPRTMSFPDLARGDDPTLVNEQMVVSVDAQLFYGVLQALPYLIDYPYECSEQTLNRFLSTAILSSMFQQYPAVAKMAAEMAKRETRLETWAETDPNRKMALEETPWLQEARGGADSGYPLLKVLDPRIAKAQRETSLAKLRKMQTSLGAFPWWPGGPPSPYMTLYVVYGFAKGLEFGIEPPKDTVTRAWAYLHRHYLDEVVRDMRKDDCCWEFVTFVNYVLSSYPDTSWTGGVFTDAEKKEMLDFSFRHWKQHSPYLKGMLALTLQRTGRRADARLVFDSVMDSAKTDEDLGTYWAPEDRAWLWYNDTIESHAFALRVLSELVPKDPRRDGLVQWLFLNKKLNHWKSTRATAEVLYSLAHYLRTEGALGAREEVRVAAGPQQARFVFEPDRYTGKSNQLVIPGDQVNAATATVHAEKEGPGLAFASATWHFSTEKLPAEDRGDLLSVSRRFFRRENRGGEWVLSPLAEGTALSPGDEVEVQLSIRARHAAEYVHLRDPRAAGLEPGVAVSRFRWNLGLGWYEEVRDSGTNFFFEQLPAGEFTFKYRLRANMAGTFRVSPATLQSMYAPEFAAYSAGAMITVGAAR